MRRTGMLISLVSLGLAAACATPSSGGDFGMEPGGGNPLTLEIVNEFETPIQVRLQWGPRLDTELLATVDQGQRTTVPVFRDASSARALVFDPRGRRTASNRVENVGPDDHLTLTVDSSFRARLVAH